MSSRQSIRCELALAGGLLGFISALVVFSLVGPLVFMRYHQLSVFVALVVPASIVGGALGAIVANLRFGATTVATFVASLVTVPLAGLLLGLGACARASVLGFEHIERALWLAAGGLMILWLPLAVVSIVVAGFLTLVRARLRRTR